MVKKRAAWTSENLPGCGVRCAVCAGYMMARLHIDFPRRAIEPRGGRGMNGPRYWPLRAAFTAINPVYHSVPAMLFIDFSS